MQFVVIAYDGTDDAALDRRLAVREDHLEYSANAATRGEHIIAAAMIDDDGKMCGSTMVVDFDTRAELDGWLKGEAYIVGDVWKKIEIFECKLAPAFQHLQTR